MTTNLDNLTFVAKLTNNWVANGPTRAFPQPLSNTNNYAYTMTLGTSVSNTTSGGADELYAELLTIAPSGTATINLANFTDVINQTAVAFARVKKWRFQLLSVADDAVNGTACSSVSVGGAGSDPFLFNLLGTTPKVQIFNGGIWEYADESATGFVVTSGTNNNILITNNDASHAAAFVGIIVGGTT
jgi:hypothetical protein